MNKEIKMPYQLILELLDSEVAEENDIFSIKKEWFDILEENNIDLKKEFPDRKYQVTPTD